METSRYDDRPMPAAHATRRPDADTGALTVDVAVIGAGPAGLSAAVAAADSGARVALIDAEPTVGGQFWRHPASEGRRGAVPERATEAQRGTEPGPLTDAEVAPLHHQLASYRRLRRRLTGHLAADRAMYRPQHEVWALEALSGDAPNTSDAPAAGAGSAVVPRFAIHAVNAASSHRPETTIRARSLVLAPGAYDLQIPFPGWDLPGVMTAGGVQSLLKGHGVSAGKRIVVAGTGPFLLSVAAGLAREGVTVPAVVEAASPRNWLRRPGALTNAAEKAWEGAGYAATLAKHRVRLRTGWGIVRADGGGALESVTIAPIGSDGTLDHAKSKRIETDVLAVGWGFVPQLELPLMLGCETVAGATGLPVAKVDVRQRSSVRGVYVAGEADGIGGAALAAVEGEIAGIAAARRSAGSAAVGQLAEQVAAQRLPYLARRRTSLRRFADALAAVYPVPDYWLSELGDDTVVCRCEEVRAGAIRAATTDSAALDARGAKLLVRPGMGYCQGRICGFATECMVAREHGVIPAHHPTERPVAAPVPLGQLAREEVLPSANQQ